MEKENKLILLSHGDGGLLTHRLLERYFLPSFKNPLLEALTDAACFPVEAGKMALTTDAFVVDPIFFPGGDIGKLAVCGTVNDLAVSGAKPVYIAASFIIEEGFPVADLERIVMSMSAVCQIADVAVAAGDTKVVGRGQADKIFITTTGIGVIPEDIELGYGCIEPGDAVIINGPVGNHGLSVLLKRESFTFDVEIESDCAPLNLVTEPFLKRFGGIRLMRDLTRGGLATNLKEIATMAQVDIWLDETSIPVDEAVVGVTQMLGLDPLYLANEGKFVTIASGTDIPDMLRYLRSHPLASNASVIGEVRQGTGNVFLRTGLGGTRRLDMLSGAPLPRIC